MCGKEPAGDPGCLKANSDLLRGKDSFSAGNLASTCIALWKESLFEGLTMLLQREYANGTRNDLLTEARLCYKQERSDCRLHAPERHAACMVLLRWCSVKPCFLREVPVVMSVLHFFFSSVTPVLIVLSMASIHNQCKDAPSASRAMLSALQECRLCPSRHGL